MSRAVHTKHPKVALYDPSESGGVAQYTFELAEGLAKTGCRVTIITSEGYELRDLKRTVGVWLLFKKSWLKSWVSTIASFMTRGSTSHVQDPPQESPRGAGDHNWTAWSVSELKSLRFTCILFRAALCLALNGTRVVHVQWIIDRRADVRFMRLLRLLGIKIVYTVHDLLPHDEYTAENLVFYQRVYGYADRLIVHSENNRKEMLELFTVDPEKISVIPHGCQSVLADHFGSSTSMARRELGIPDDARVILFFGLIRRYKGLEVLLEAFETIKSRCGNVMLLIAGKIADHDPDSHRHYSELLAEVSGNDGVRFKNAYVPLDQVTHYFHAADLVVLPYLKASQSGVLMSAYAAGKPVVVTETGGLGEVVKNGQSGFVVPPKDAQAIAEASLRILNDPDVRRRFGLEARMLAETTYSWTAIGRTTATLYHSLIYAGRTVGSSTKVTVQ